MAALAPGWRPAAHRLQQATDLPVNATRSYTWDSAGNVRIFTDERGHTVTNYWDGLHRLTGTTDARGATTNLFYRLDNTPYASSTGGTNILDLTATRDRMGYWTYFDYDSLRRRIALTNANHVVTRYGYCDCGAVSYITNAWTTPVEQVTIFNYDNQGNRTISFGPDGYNVTNWYDSLQRLYQTSDGNGYRWLYYNNLGLLTGVADAYGLERTTIYDLEGRPVYVTDANGVTITNTYDELGRLRLHGYPDGGVEKFGYSARGLTAYTNLRHI